jgi:hypothetical protein
MLSTEMGVLDFGSHSFSIGSDSPFLICNFSFRVLDVSCIDAVPSVDAHCRDRYQIACSAEGWKRIDTWKCSRVLSTARSYVVQEFLKG